VLELDQHVLLGGEMEVKGAAGDACRPHDIVDLAVGEATRRNSASAASKSRFAGILALLIAPAKLEDFGRRQKVV
jgi:hypothetical protein